MKRIFILSVAGLMMAGSFTITRAQTIQNPYHSEVDWKLWYENQSPVTVGANTLSPRPEAYRFYPTDPTPVEAATGQYLKVVPDDYPGRRYAGFFNDGYDTADNWHTTFPWRMLFNDGNEIVASENNGGTSMATSPRYITGNAYPKADFPALGIQVSNQSTTLMGHDILNYQTLSVERDWYFKNALRAGPTYISYQSGTWITDSYMALFPAYFNGNGASYWQFGGYGKMMYAGSYLPTETKKKLLHNGVLPSTVLYNWKSNLPYKVPYDHMMRHRILYEANGIQQEGFNVPHSFEYMANFQFQYDANIHFANMVEQYKSMDVTAPITLIKAVEIIQGAYNSKISGADQLKTLVALEHPAAGDRTVIVRVSTEDSFDLQGYPLTVRAKLLYGNKDTQVEHESEHIWKVTVPWSDTIPEGRTDLIFVANNGVYDSNPAVVSVMRPFDSVGQPDKADIFNLVRTPSGLPQVTKMVPSENIQIDLTSEDENGLPVSFYMHEGADGNLDGSRYILNTTTSTPESENNVMVTAANERTGDSMNGVSGKLYVQNTVAELSADTMRGAAPFTVSFDATGSRDRDGNTMSYAWDFNDGSSTGNVSSTSHTFTTPGIYQVRVTATGALGSDTQTVLVQVEPNTWALALNRGWTFGTSTLDPASWTGSSFSILAPTDTDSSGHIEVKSTLTSVPNFTLPLMIEADFNYNKTNYEQSYFDFFGHRLGMLMDWDTRLESLVPADNGDGKTTARYSSLGFEANYKDANLANRWDRHLGSTPADDYQYITLRVSLRDDPNHSGKMVIVGEAITEIGTYPIYLDNLDKHGDKLKLISTVGRFKVARYQVWTPTGTLNHPDIAVVDEENNRLWDNREPWGWHYPWKMMPASEFGTVDTVNGSKTKTYTIRNRGNSPLILTGTPTVNTYAWGPFKNGITQPAVTNLAPGASTTFSVTFDPGEWDTGTQGTDLWIESNSFQGGGDAGVFRVPLRGRNAIAKEINVEGNGLNIASGDTTPNETDHTDFGTIVLGETLTRDFLIHNLGTVDLALSMATLSGSSDFTIVKQPRAVISDFGSTLVSVRYAPTAIGNHAATLTVNSDDSDEAAYTIALAGSGEAFVAPDISVFHEGSTVASASTLNLGDHPLISEHDYETLVVSNSTGTLNITTATITGTDSNAFFVTVYPSPVVAGGLTSPLQIEFAPDTARSYSAVLTVYSDDADTPAYTINLSAIATTGPLLKLQGKGFDIENGDATPDLADGTDAGAFSSTSVDQLFTLRNPATGSALAISSIIFSGANAGDYQVVAPTPTSIPADGSANLTVRLTPNGSGIRMATMTITSDASNSPFVVNLQGDYTPPTLSVTHDEVPVSSGSILDVGSFSLSTESFFETLVMSNSVGDLSISSITFSGPDAAFFTIPAPPIYPLIIAAEGTSPVELKFTPTTARSYSAVITINSDDLFTPAYTIVLNGTATSDVLMRLSGKGNNIANGDTTPSKVDGTDFGTAGPGQSIDRVFTISNPALLETLSISDITLTGPGAGSFSILPPSPTSVAATGTADLTVRFASEVIETYDATLTINSDALDAPFTVAFRAQRSEWGIQDLSGIVPPQPDTIRLTAQWIDYDLDGDLDLFRFGNEKVGSNTLLTAHCYENTAGVFAEDTAALSQVVLYSSGPRVSWSDYDGDGDQDFFMANNSGTVAPENLYRNDAGVFAKDTTSGFGTLWYGNAAWGDIDNDGAPDLSIAGMLSPTFNSGAIEVYSNTSASFSKTGSVPSGTYSCNYMEWVDVDGDGYLDLIIQAWWLDAGWAQSLRIYKNNAGTLSSTILADIAGDWQITTGDYDGDGDIDLALMGININIALYWNDGGSFTYEDSGIASLTQSGALTSGDIDNDGDLDLVVTGSITPDYYTRVLVNSNGTFHIDSNLEWSDGVTYSTLSLADVDNDGDLDIFTTGYDSAGNGAVLLYINPTEVTLTPYESWSDGIAWNGADSSLEADGDNDGINNQWEYAMDLDPTVFDASAFSIQIKKQPFGTFFWFDHRRNVLATELVWSLQASSNLVSNAWDTLPEGGDIVIITVNPNIDGDGSAELIRYRIRLDSADAQYYYRLGIE